MDNVGKVKQVELIVLALLFCLLPSCTVQRQSTMLLDRPVTMKVYSAEILESVINRIGLNTGQDIKFNTIMLLPYRAKAREYKDITVREILNDQLKGTPMKYQLLDNGLIIYNAETGDHSTNR